MTTKNNTVSVSTSFKSLRDMAYTQALAGDLIENSARYAIDNIQGFPESCPDESKALLIEGYRLRYNERLAPTVIITDGGHERTLKVEDAYMYTQQAFGALKTSEPILHEALKEIRNKTSAYCSNRFGDLVKYAKRVKSEGIDKPPRVNLNYDEYVAKRVESDYTRAKQFVNRGVRLNLDAVRKAGIAYEKAMQLAETK